MKLSIVIVNYNVKYFLSNCLQSVFKALEGIDSEVIVVDNMSSDLSVEMVSSLFPSVILIANEENAGFSKANNQAIKIARGEYILLLNPDTVVEESCFSRCIEYMDNHAQAGGLGVKMMDGAGRFLPESKRGLPTPAVAFYKLSGLSKLFPASRIFGKYHLGYLDENEIAEIEVLSGAFMFLRKEVLNKTGGLDETFFMYGEDIDMSYRITQAGYKNIYFPESRIIHFKGESTKKSSVNYVLVFYRAMIIFAKKHFSQKNARVFSFLINLAIYLRALIALVNRFITRIYMPVIDVILFWLVLLVLKEFYETWILRQAGYYPSQVEITAFPVLISCWITGQLITGGYHQPVKLKSVFKGLITGALFVFVLYAMLDESHRFSRAIVVFSVLTSFLLIPVSRIILSKLRLFQLIRFTEINSAIIGSVAEIQRVKKILLESPERKKNLFYINPKTKKESQDEQEDIAYSGSLYQLNDAIGIFDLDELIFCLKDVSAGDMMDQMQQKSVGKCNIYFHPEEGDYLLRSSSVNSTGEFILPESNPVMSKWSKMKKRTFELSFALLMILFSPFMILLYRKPGLFIKNMAGIVSGKIKLVGFVETGEKKHPVIPLYDYSENSGQILRGKVDYMLNYSTEKDLEIVLAGLSQLDRKPC